MTTRQLKPGTDDRVRSYPGGLKPCALPSGQERLSVGRPLPVVAAVGDLLTLFGHVISRLAVGNRGRRRALLAILGVVVGLLILRVAAGTGYQGRESCVPVPGTQDRRSLWPSGSSRPRDLLFKEAFAA
jgi:hypothetical protein